MAPTPIMETQAFEEEFQRLSRNHPVMKMTRNDKETAMEYVNIPHVVAMVGLPARGKTFIAMKLARYLNWVGLPTKVFNVGDYRRQAVGSYPGHDFFHPRNREGVNIRNKCALDGLQDVCEFLQGGGMVAVYDATNTDRDRRRLIHDVIAERMGYKLFFIESICKDASLIEANIMDSKVTNPDYTDMEKEDAVKDFLKRVESYASVYQVLDEEKEPDYSFMKIFDAGRRVVVHKQEGHIQSRIAYYLMNIHITTRSIYLTRHGESTYNQLGRIGGDTDLSHRGRQYANALAKFIEDQTIPNLRVWTSCMKRTIQTASAIKAPQERWKSLNEIDAGICEGLMYEEIQEQYPEEFSARDQNKYSYRYPRGESYEDVVVRLESVIMELERNENVLVVGHQAVLRCVLAYFLDKNSTELPYLKVPLHTIIKLTPQAYGCKVEFFKIPIDCVDTHRNKPLPPGSEKVTKVFNKFLRSTVSFDSVTRNDEGKEENLPVSRDNRSGASGTGAAAACGGNVEVIEGVPVNVLRNLTGLLSVHDEDDNRLHEDDYAQASTTRSNPLPESARAVHAVRRNR